jgi:hypothetical protein
MLLAMFLFFFKYRHIVLVHVILVIMQRHYNATLRQRIGARAGR